MNTLAGNSADVIIVGGGLAGATLAALLSRHEISCLLVEEHGSQPVAGRIDPRALAMTHASANILRFAGAWGLLPRERIGHFRQMQVWDRSGPGTIAFDSAELCESTLGYIVEQTLLEQCLRESTRAAGLISCREGAVTEILIKDQSVEVQLQDGKLLSARLVVGADGARSQVRRLAGIAWPIHDYHQAAVACIVNTERPHEDIARQCFLEDGPLAFLPMARVDQCAIVWSTSPEHARALIQMEETEFNPVLAEAFTHTLGMITGSGPRAIFPLQHAQAETYCQPRLALIGDAAHNVHPLAGQGANLGLLDAASLAEVLIDARTRDKDPGAYPVLRRYERWRKGENYLMLKVLQGFKAIFESQSAPVRHLRNTGLDLTNRLALVKHLIMRHAMGIAGDLPLFARHPL